MNLNQSPGGGPFAQRIPPNQNFIFNPQNNRPPLQHQHPVNTYLPSHVSYRMEFDGLLFIWNIYIYFQIEPPAGMMPNNFYQEEIDVDKFLAGNGNENNEKIPLPNMGPYQMRMNQDNRENQYFLSNCGNNPSIILIFFFFF